MTRKKKSAHAILKKNIFHLKLVESWGTEPTDVEGRLYVWKLRTKNFASRRAELRLYLDLTSLPRLFSCSGIQSKILQCSCPGHWDSSGLCEFLRLPLSFMTLRALRGTGQSFVAAPYLGLCDVLSWLDWASGFGERILQRGNVPPVVSYQDLRKISMMDLCSHWWPPGGP